MGVVRLMRQIVARGEIGEPKTIWVRHFVGHGGDYYFKDWHADRRNTTGLLVRKGAHDIDVLYWIAGGYATRVTAMGDLMVYGDLPRRDPAAGHPDDRYAPELHWPPRSQRGLNPVVDVEDVALLTMRLSNGVLAAYQQCHFTPDYWRNYTVIGDAGRLENVGDMPGGVVRIWNSRRSDHRKDADVTYRIPDAIGSHGGADRATLDEFRRFVRHGAPTDTSPVAARMSVAAAVQGTRSLRERGVPYNVPSLDPNLAAYFEGGQVVGNRR
jgi:predicted dehydrogenase